MAPHSSPLAWKIPWVEEPGRLQSMGLRRVGHDWATSLSVFTFMHWRRQWQPTPVFLPGESQGRGSLVGCRLWGRAESDTNWSDLAAAAAAAAITIRKTFRIESRAWWLLESEEWKKGRNLESHHMIDYWQTIESTMVGKINQAPSLTNIKSDEDEKQLNTYLKWSEISVMVVECLSDCFLSVC